MQYRVKSAKSERDRLAFLALIVQLDHRPGAFPDAATVRCRLAAMDGNADGAPADDSPTFRAFRTLALCRRIDRAQLRAAHALLCPDMQGAGAFRQGDC